MTINNLKTAVKKGVKLYFGKHRISEIDLKTYEPKYNRIAIKAYSYSGNMKFWACLKDIKTSNLKKK